MILPILLLQKPSAKSRCKDHSKSLTERILKWQSVAIDELLQEGRTIQGRPTRQQHVGRDNVKIARAFEKLVSVGNVKAAIRLM